MQRKAHSLSLLTVICMVVLFCAAAATASAAQGIFFTTLATFDGTNGASPEAALIQASDGNFYGTTIWGGTNGSYGTVFKMAPNGTLTTLYSFCAQSNCTDGELPYAALVQGADGDLYGTTAGGGAYNDGTVFRITPAGDLRILHSFAGSDGNDPSAGLVLARDGNFYGTTLYGGANNTGTFFKITPSGTLTAYSIETGGSALVQGNDGNFYGTTSGGGAYGGGTVFKITPTGTMTTLYSFCNLSECPDGERPSGLAPSRDGNFYGTTQAGGTNCIFDGGCGTVFKITPTGMLATIYNFCSQPSCSDGVEPVAQVVQAADGNLYGTTCCGGDGAGVVFKLTAAGTLTVLHNFDSGGEDYKSALTQARDGYFYGTKSAGGDLGCGFDGQGCGTVYRVGVVHTCAMCRP